MHITRQVLFVQGGGERVHDDWDAKLVASLGEELGPDYQIHYPRVPNEDDPSYAAWRAMLESELARLDDGASSSVTRSAAPSSSTRSPSIRHSARSARSS